MSFILKVSGLTYKLCPEQEGWILPEVQLKAARGGCSPPSQAWL